MAHGVCLLPVRDASFIPILLLIITVFAVIVFFSIQQAQQHAQTLQRVANRYRGRLQPGTLFSRGEIRLRFQGYHALLKFVQAGKHSVHTVFSITWPEPSFRLEIYPQDVLAGFRRLWGMEDIEIGSPEFDRSFYISGNSRAAVRDMLSSEVQHAIFKLERLTDFSREIQVKFLGGVLTITKPCKLFTEAHLDEFIRLSSELFEAALRTRSTGIEFVGEVAIDAKEPDADQSQCQVCGEPLAKDLVYCGGCRTPHHRECWEYFGGCSTYACGEKKFVTKTKRRKAS
jgi:hypothetical protein